MNTYLWKINESKLNRTNLALYSSFIEKNYKISFGNNYNHLWKWSIENTELFWKSISDFTKARSVGPDIRRQASRPNPSPISKTRPVNPSRRIMPVV